MSEVAIDLARVVNLRSWQILQVMQKADSLLRNYVYHETLHMNVIHVG